MLSMQKSEINYAATKTIYLGLILPNTEMAARESKKEIILE